MLWRPSCRVAIMSRTKLGKHGIDTSHGRIDSVIPGIGGSQQLTDLCQD